MNKEQADELTSKLKNYLRYVNIDIDFPYLKIYNYQNDFFYVYDLSILSYLDIEKDMHFIIRDIVLNYVSYAKKSLITQDFNKDFPLIPW